VPPTSFVRQPNGHWRPETLRVDGGPGGHVESTRVAIREEGNDGRDRLDDVDVQVWADDGGAMSAARSVRYAREVRAHASVF